MKCYGWTADIKRSFDFLHLFGKKNEARRIAGRIIFTKYATHRIQYAVIRFDESQVFLNNSPILFKLK